jgi:hypothetical protein
MKVILTIPLRDEDLRCQLASGNTLLFVGERIDWQKLERQVERLGFGEDYLVSARQGRAANAVRISVEPIRTAA